MAPAGRLSSLLVSVLYIPKYWPDRRKPGPVHGYHRLRDTPRDEDEDNNDDDDDDDDDDMASPEEIGVSETTRNVVDPGMAKRVLRKIDMRIIPLLFATYMLNFMDKTILSSASVFGLRDDTVRTYSHNTLYSWRHD
jgi:hypothetical protein